MSFTVEPWDPGYGLAFAAGLDDDDDALAESSAQLDLDLEVPASRWRPVDPDPGVRPPDVVNFLDGVRRIDARVWVHDDGTQPVPGIAASLAVGLACCDGQARVAGVLVERGLYTAAKEAAGIVTRAVSYPAHQARGGTPDELSLAMQDHLARIEVRLAQQFRAGNPQAGDLLVIDGPLRGRTHLERTVGYVKTHHSRYLPAEQARVVTALRPGQRTPAFTMGTSWRRHSWYLQLAGTPGVPWSGIVRLECPADLPREQVSELADVTARLLPPLASAPHKDPRAPQNLVPIGGLERQLRHRLGDQQLLYRALRAAAAFRR
jgi:hypothetical protein